MAVAVAVVGTVVYAAADVYGIRLPEICDISFCDAILDGTLNSELIAFMGTGSTD